LGNNRYEIVDILKPTLKTYTPSVNNSFKMCMDIV